MKKNYRQRWYIVLNIARTLLSVYFCFPSDFFECPRERSVFYSQYKHNILFTPEGRERPNLFSFHRSGWHRRAGHGSGTVRIPSCSLLNFFCEKKHPQIRKFHKKRPELLRDNWWFTAHSALSIWQFYVKNQKIILPQLSYSPDLGPYDFFYSLNWNRCWKYAALMT